MADEAEYNRSGYIYILDLRSACEYIEYVG